MVEKHIAKTPPVVAKAAQLVLNQWESVPTQAALKHSNSRQPSVALTICFRQVPVQVGALRVGSLGPYTVEPASAGPFGGRNAPLVL